MYTDRCDILPITRDSQFGNETLGTAVNTKCREETEDTVKKSNTGSNVAYKRLYILPPSTSINKGDRIRTTKRRGKTVTEDYANVDEVFILGRYKPHHIEVYIYSV